MNLINTATTNKKNLIRKENVIGLEAHTVKAGQHDTLTFLCISQSVLRCWLAGLTCNPMNAP